MDLHKENMEIKYEIPRLEIASIIPVFQVNFLQTS